MRLELRWKSHLGAYCLCAVSSTACATTTGLAWVNERESGVDLRPPSSHAAEFHTRRPLRTWASGSADCNMSESDPSCVARQPPRRRLDHTVTLGGEASGADRRAEATETASGQPIINIYVTPGPAYGAGYGYGSAYGFGVPLVTTGVPFIGTTTRNVSMQMAAPALRPGLDWPAVPNAGPAFPYRTGPASPWTGENPRRR